MKNAAIKVLFGGEFAIETVGVESAVNEIVSRRIDQEAANALEQVDSTAEHSLIPPIRFQSYGAAAASCWSH